MRALWSARVSVSPNVSITMRSTSREQVSSRQAARASCAAPASSPCAFSARASANLPFAVIGFCVRKKEITVAAGRRSSHSALSARRRSIVAFGQLGLSQKAARRSKPPSFSSLRRIAHSTSLRASGSPMVFWTVVASLVLPRRARSIACLTSAISAAGVAAAFGGGERRGRQHGRDLRGRRGGRRREIAGCAGAGRSGAWRQRRRDRREAAVARTGVGDRLNGGFGAEATANWRPGAGQGDGLAGLAAAFAPLSAQACGGRLGGFGGLLVRGLRGGFAALLAGFAAAGFAGAGLCGCSVLGFSAGFAASAGAKRAPETSAASVHSRSRRERPRSKFIPSSLAAVAAPVSPKSLGPKTPDPAPNRFPPNPVYE